MKIVAISDTHGSENLVEIPECDILIHAGDAHIMNHADLDYINRWFSKQPAKHKIFIAGNHDGYLEKQNKHLLIDILYSVNYLQDSYITVEGLKIYGTPWSPIFQDWYFMKDSEFLKRQWSKIPDNVDILITHTPPFGILDHRIKANGDLGMSCGCPFLRDRVKQIQPKVHIFGHMHGGYGKYTDYKINYYNCSLMNEQYKLVNKPTIIEL